MLSFWAGHVNFCDSFCHFLSADGCEAAATEGVRFCGAQDTAGKGFFLGDAWLAAVCGKI
jgi:hypothetical protein